MSEPNNDECSPSWMPSWMCSPLGAMLIATPIGVGILVVGLFLLLWLSKQFRDPPTSIISGGRFGDTESFMSTASSSTKLTPQPEVVSVVNEAVASLASS